ncbi:hypothetical protein OHA04_45495 (plasmid) [Streptomyces sp. NBC_01590]|uniref:hypothetical protein n=1 Tax=Streptomyces sp. NBC_01590 TaxID=2975887 RepID=UPI002F90BBFE
MTINVTHDGDDQMGAPTTHRGLRENCPAPECQDRVIEAEEAWGVYCEHGHRIVERDPDLTDPEGHPVGRLVTPWPCHEDDCSLERFQAAEQADEDECWASLMSEVHQ